MIKLADIKSLYNFEPEYSYSQLQQYVPQRAGSQIRMQDSKLYELVDKLTEKACPTEESAYEKRWDDFYLPFKRRGYFILIPLTIVLYEKTFFLCVLHSTIEVCKGKEKYDNNFYWGLIKQTLKICQILRKNPGIVRRKNGEEHFFREVFGKTFEDLVTVCKRTKWPATRSLTS